VHSTCQGLASWSLSADATLTERRQKLEFDLVVLIEPGMFVQGIEGAVDRRVAMTRATRRLLIPTSR
jgi:hypothetical protein